MTLYLPAGADPTTYYKYGPTPSDRYDHWYGFMYDPLIGTGAEINGNEITLHFIDGERGDDDLIANGTVTDQGGPGFIRGTSTPEHPSGGGGGCFIATADYGSAVEVPHP